MRGMSDASSRVGRGRRAGAPGHAPCQYLALGDAGHRHVPRHGEARRARGHPGEHGAGRAGHLSRHATMPPTMTADGEPGANDTLGITVNAGGTPWCSSDGSPTATPQEPGGGTPGWGLAAARRWAPQARQRRPSPSPCGRLAGPVRRGDVALRRRACLLPRGQAPHDRPDCLVRHAVLDRQGVQALMPGAFGDLRLEDRIELRLVLRWPPQRDGALHREVDDRGQVVLAELIPVTPATATLTRGPGSQRRPAGR